MRWLSLCALLCLAACGDCDGEPPSVPPARTAVWLGYPRPQVVASEGLADCQRAGVAASVAWWGVMTGEPLLVRWAPPDAFELALPPQGVIAVNGEPPLTAGDYATAIVHTDASGTRMHSVEVRIGTTCRVRAIAHEFGHALGWVEHARGPGRLMSHPFPATTWTHP